MTTTTGHETMAYWDEVIAGSCQIGTPYERGEVSRGWMFNKIFNVFLRRGEPVRAVELGDAGAPDIEFHDPIRVYQDIAAEKLNPFYQVYSGMIPVTEFAGRFLSAKSPERFYAAPLLYFREAETFNLPGMVTQGQAEWDAFKANIGRKLPEPEEHEAPWLESPLMQRVFSLSYKDGQARQIVELPAAGSPAINWEPPSMVWEDMATGAFYPTRYVETIYSDVESMVLTLFMHKDASHIGYEFALR
jgi:hypothetical protein